MPPADPTDLAAKTCGSCVHLGPSTGYGTVDVCCYHAGPVDLIFVRGRAIPDRSKPPCSGVLWEAK